MSENDVLGLFSKLIRVPYIYYIEKFVVLLLWWKGKVRTGFCELSPIIWNVTQEVYCLQVQGPCDSPSASTVSVLHCTLEES